ncbi:MAG: 3-oxoadipate enol-lactonase [Xanthobacteraceae bacterium]|nr:3-oxoadipate enol-lactonase [Xanthobacteraceae bacterium]
MPILEANGIKINYQIDGADNAPVLMMSNSLGTNLHMWDNQVAALAKRFRVVRYDTRGHGKTEAPLYPYTFAMLGQDAIALMDTLKLTKVRFCGLSMGGMIGMWLARNVPARIEQLVLCNTAAKFGLTEIWNQRIATVRTSGMKAITGAVIERWFTKEFREKSPKEIDRIVEALHATKPEGYAGNCAAIRDVDQRWSIYEIKTPTLVIGGKHDPATPYEAAELIAKRIPGAKLVGLDAAHLSNIEQPDAFAKALNGFLKGYK